MEIEPYLSESEGEIRIAGRAEVLPCLDLRVALEKNEDAPNVSEILESIGMVEVVLQSTPGDLFVQASKSLGDYFRSFRDENLVTVLQRGKELQNFQKLIENLASDILSSEVKLPKSTKQISKEVFVKLKYELQKVKSAKVEQEQVSCIVAVPVIGEGEEFKDLIQKLSRFLSPGPGYFQNKTGDSLEDPGLLDSAHSAFPTK